MSRYVQIRPDALQWVVEHHQLTITERWLLTQLVLHARWDDGIYRGTQSELAQLVGLSRRNLPPRLNVLEEKRLIETYWPRGHSGGVRVLLYLDLVRLSRGPQATQHPLRKRQLGPLWEHLGRTPKATQHRKQKDAASLVAEETSWSERCTVMSLATARGTATASPTGQGTQGGTGPRVLRWAVPEEPFD